MGLAGRKTKQRIPADPRNLSWANDANKFGAAYMQKLGWDPTTGLGPSGEGRTKAISVYQKLDMLGVGADHRNNQDGTAWKQGRDFESLLRRLNEGKGGENEESMKVDGFVRPASTLEQLVEEEVPEKKVDGAEEIDGEAKEKREKKRKRRERGGEDGAVDNAVDGKKKRKKLKGEDEDSVEKRKKDKKDKKRRKEQTEIDIIEISASAVLETVTVSDGTVVAQTKTGSTTVQRPLRAHRARHIAAKGMAAKSSIAISEILGDASSLSVTPPPVLATPAEPASSDKNTDASSELKMQDLTTSSKSVMDYFREKLAAKSNRASASVSVPDSPAPRDDAPDDCDDRPRGGLGASRLGLGLGSWEETPRFGLGTGKPVSDAQIDMEKAADESVTDDVKEKKNKRDKKGKGRELVEDEGVRSTSISPEIVVGESSDSAPIQAVNDEREASHKKKKEKKKKRMDEEKDGIADVAAQVSKEVGDAESGRKEKKSKSKRKKDRGDD